MSRTAASPIFDWADPLLAEDMLSEEERLARDSARAYCQEKLLPRVLTANREERFLLPENFIDQGKLQQISLFLRR